MKKLSADEDLAIHQNAIRMLPGWTQAQIDAALARNILHDDLGYFTDPNTTYHLNDTVRDRLIAHTRQDAAHALVVAISNQKAIARVNIALRIAILLLAIMLVVQIYNALL